MSLYFKGEEQSLEDILGARDYRVQYQQYLLSNFGSTIISYKLNIPGPIKYNSLIKDIFDEGLVELKQKLKEFSIETLHEKVEYKNSGPEYFAAYRVYSNVSSYILKKLVTHIEETHPLGRLYDFDVIDAEGTQLTRQEFGIGPRKCLLCKNNAFECGRSRNHGVDELIAKIESMYRLYFNPTK